MTEPGSSTEAGREVAEQSTRERSVVAMLRQLWLGLSTYRLYPENPNRPGFASSVERVGAAVAGALATGPADVEIRGDRFVLGGSVLPQEDALERLALACFERRVERLTVTAVPGAEDLERLYATLTTPAADLEEAGGAESVLREAGVSSVSLSAIGPGTVEEADHVPEEMAAQQARRLDVDVLASELMVEDLHGSPVDQAETLLARLRGVIGDEALVPGSRIDVHAAVHDMVTDLPVEVRRSLVEMLVDRVRQDPVAGKLLATMSNAELTRALVDVGTHGRRDPVQLARELASAGVRQVDIVDLTRALEAGHEDAGTIIAGLEQLGIEIGEDAPPGSGGSVLEVLAEYLSATESDDVRSVQAAIASSPEDVRAAQAMAIADYLSLESDLERAGEALAIWSDELRRALRARDEREVVALLQPIRGALLGGSEERPALFDGYVRRALDRDVVLEAVTAEAVDGHPHLVGMLAPFAEHGVDVLLDLLADEQDRQRRALLLGALRRIGPHHPGPVLSRLRDGRWFVVRNAVSILGSGRNPAVLPRLKEVATHPSAEVRREVPEAIANAGGAAGVPPLVELALEGPPDVRRPAVTSLGTLVGREAADGLAEVALRAGDRALRVQAIDELGGRSEDRDVLQALVSGADGSRLPWRLRRHARRVLGRGEGRRG